MVLHERGGADRHLAGVAGLVAGRDHDRGVAARCPRRNTARSGPSGELDVEVEDVLGDRREGWVLGQLGGRFVGPPGRGPDPSTSRPRTASKSQPYMAGVVTACWRLLLKTRAATTPSPPSPAATAAAVTGVARVPRPRSKASRSPATTDAGCAEPGGPAGDAARPASLDELGAARAARAAQATSTTATSRPTASDRHAAHQHGQVDVDSRGRTSARRASPQSRPGDAARSGRRPSTTR